MINYTTEIAAEKSINEIQELLRKAGCSAIMTEFDEAGKILFLSFKIKTKHGVLPFRLPSSVENVYHVLIKNKNTRHGSFKIESHKKQAERVAWRVLKDWLAAQLSLIEIEMATVEQIFLPYLQSPTGQTVYELFDSHGPKALGFNPGEKS